MNLQVMLPDELIAQIDERTNDREAFITEAIRRLLHDPARTVENEVDRLNLLADELNREAEDVLEYQVLS